MSPAEPVELAWEGRLIHVGASRICSITPEEVMEALNDGPRGYEEQAAAWREVLAQIPDDGHGMMLWKSKAMIDQLAQLVAEIDPRYIFELGIAHGGSTAVLAELAPRAKVVSIDVSPDPVEPLADHIRLHHLDDRVRPYYGVDQGDRRRLVEIIEAEFGDEPIDLVIDDASHQLDLTLASFEELYPRLAPGGCFVLEDWSWAHYSLDGDLDRLPSGPPLTDVVIDLLLALGSSGGVVERLELESDWARIWRGSAVLEPGRWTLADSYRLLRPLRSR
jgi:predicted O-methyltransferase YrrM